MTLCYVCDKEVTDEIYITSSETFFTKTTFLTKISQLMGNDFMVVAAEEDQICKRCATLLNKSDKLEVDLLEINNMIKRFLDFKYDLISKEDQCDESEKIEYYENKNEPKDFDTVDFYSRSFGLPFNDDDGNINQKSPSIVNSELLKLPSISEPKIKAEPSSDIAEEIDTELNKEENETSSQTDENFTVDVKLEHYNGEDSFSLTSDEIVCDGEEQSHPYMSNETLKTNKEKTSILRNVKTSDKGKKTNPKNHLDGSLKSLKNRPILPKIVKSIDILKLASLGVFEPIDPSNIIKITTDGTNQPVELSIQEQEESLDSTNAGEFSKTANTGHKKGYQTIFKCEICEKECSTKNRLEMHKTVHEKKVCDFCGRAFNSNYRLKVHRNIHTKQKKYACNVCGKTFIHHSTYWYHRKWHDEPYPYSCEFCGKLFKHSSILAIHRRKHTGERPYKCSYCPLTFTISTTMKKHEMLHTNEFAFTCDICHKGFTTRSKFVYHTARMHKDVEQGDNVSKRSTKKSGKKKMSQPSDSSNSELLEIDNSYEYVPLELQEGIEVVVGNETEEIDTYNDISVEVINLDSSHFDQETNENVITDHSNVLPVDLGEGVVEIVLGPDEYVLSDDTIAS